MAEEEDFARVEGVAANIVGGGGEGFAGELDVHDRGRKGEGGDVEGAFGRSLNRGGGGGLEADENKSGEKKRVKPKEGAKNGAFMP